MARRYEEITELYQQTQREIMNPEAWQNFLKTACRNYKLRFDEQILVYAQRRDAIAVLEIERWSKVFGRWVNRGAKGIAVFEDADRNSQRLVHYFDISDTHESRYSRPVPIWDMKPEYTDDVIESLENTFGELENKDSLADTVMSAVKNAVRDNISDHLSDLLYYNSSLSELPEDMRIIMYKKVITNSAAYMIMTRLGIDADLYFTAEDFADVAKFSSPELLNAIGIATNEIVVTGLEQIAYTIRVLEKQNAIIENKINTDYNENRQQDERGLHDERNRVHNAGRLQSSQPENAQTAGSDFGQIRSDEERISQRTPQNSVLQSPDELHSDRAPSGSRTGSDEAGRNPDEADGSARGLDREPESDGYDEVGTGYEQPEEQSTGDRDGGSNLRLGYYDRTHEDKSLPFFGGDDTIREILGTTPHLKVSKDEIRAFYESNPDNTARTEYIKGIFNNDYTEVILSDGRRVGYKTWQNVLQLWEGSYGSRTAQGFYDWGVIAQHFEAMRLLGELQDTMKPIPSMDEQLSFMKMQAEEKTSAFSFSQEIIDTILTRGSGVSEGKFRIFEQFEKSLSAKENIDFLKDEYGWGGSYPVITGTGIDEHHDGKGILISKGIGDDKPHIRLTWNQVEKRIKELIRLDRYLNPKEKEIYPQWLEKQEEHRTELAEEQRNREILSPAPQDTLEEAREKAHSAGLPFYDSPYDEDDIDPYVYDGHMSIEDYELMHKLMEQDQEQETQYAYHLGDTVYMGANEYEIVSMNGDHVVIHDVQFPLFQKEMDRAEFDRMVRENPMNDHLKVKELPPEEKTDEAPAFDIGMGYLGNGLTVWNRAVEENGDYQNIAHISSEGEIHYYADGLPEDVVTRIEQAAAQERQKALFAASYQVGDRVYLDGKPFEITRVDDWNVELMDRSVQNPQPRLESKDNFMQLVQQNERNSRFTDNYREYSEIKRKNPDNLVLYQVGDFFEVYGADAQTVSEALELNLTSHFIGNNQRTQMCGFPANRLETYVNMLLDRGFDVTVSAAENGERNIRNIVSNNKEDPVQSQPIGRIEYLHTDGTVRESIEYTSPYQFTRDIREETYYGVPFKAVFYKDKEGNTISREFADHLDPPPQNIEIIDSPYLENIHLEPIKESVSKEEKAGQHDPEQKETEPLTPAFNRPKRSRVQTFDLHPEIPLSERHTFDLASHEVLEAGKKERFRRNMEAIRVLKECEFENRFATPEEQEILSQYVGWGGIPEAFDENNSSWADEFIELYTALSPDEYESARASTLTAFYTPPVVISSIYKAMEQMGFHEGNILEPSCGIGNFIGMLPQSMQDSKVYGVEIDKISAGIAQQLYQKTSIAAQPFEEADIPDSFFDAVIGNVPFGDIRVNDRRYNKHNFLIHDYFFAKSLDKLRPGGVMALITSKGTMDKESPAVRKYIAQRADLLGAIRLPNNTFKGNAGTEVVSDILILQKRDRLVDLEPDWVHLNTDENGVKMNSYFVDHPEMVLGEWKTVSGRFGEENTVVPYENAGLAELLEEAISNIHAEITGYEMDEELTEEDNSIPADPEVRNFSYTVVDDKIYYRENSRMAPVDVSATAENRIRGMIELRECVRRLIEYQTEGYPDEDIQAEQKKLNALYDSFTAKYGLISSRGNKLAFAEDSSYCLLCSLEVLDEQGNLKRKADMFSKRTIRPHVAVTSVDTASEALAVSISEKACVDMDYMAKLSGKSPEELESELSGVIYRDIQCAENAAEIPTALVNLSQYSMVTADEYLSGNVRRKLRMAKAFYEAAPDEQKESVRRNVEALEAVQPPDLGAGEIGVRIGANWVPIDIYQQFMEELFTPAYYVRNRIKILRSEATGQWAVTEKNADRGNVKAITTYGTKRISAYHILEQTLNQKNTQVFDYIEDENGNKKAVLNKKETAIAQDKQELIKQKFSEWIWRDIDRRERLCRIYNETFNSIRPREYDGQHIRFEGMNPEISLRTHQVNAIAHVLYGGNTLLAHEVGAGKTYEMVAAAMEMKRLGLCTKSLIVVPNHITEQWAAEFLQLYPSANILVATKKDFEKQNRKKFCSRISTGDYDAIIIGHSQFEKIPMSAERQQAILQQQIDEIIFGIKEAKKSKAENYTIKQMERTRKSLETKLAKLNDQSRKDDVVTFEELGVDRIFVDESHYFKNLFLATKMRNVGGIAQTEAQKSSDLFMKCLYLDELTGGRGVIFATGTPISNSMVELYTIQRYLQYSTLQEMSLIHFDDWASNFGETVTAIELSPEGSGYRAKTRFAKFYNLPELMSVFKQVADIQTADMLNLPVPKANFHTEVIKPSEIQQEMVKSLAERAEKVRAGLVEPYEDNMLKITNDGRKLALDMRLIQPLAPDDPNGKVAVCARNVYRIWEQTKEERSTQLVFCDLSTPKSDGSFNVYDDLKKKLMDAGIPENEIAFIHTADSETKKKELFAKVRAGQVRVLMGSTQKMGAGTNVQDKLIALHDLDCPWRPSDLQQRLGRIVRQGNNNEEVEIFRYVTEGTFDAYLYQLVENKQKFIAQIMTSKAPVRVAEDVDETALSYSEIKALATGNPLIIEKAQLDADVSKLNMLKANHLNQKYMLENMVYREFPAEIAGLTERIAGYEKDIELVKTHPKSSEGFCGMEAQGKFYAEKEDAGNAIIKACAEVTDNIAMDFGTYRGFSLALTFDRKNKEYHMIVKGALSHTVTLGTNSVGNITRLDNVLENLTEELKSERNELKETNKQLENAQNELKIPFDKEQELTEKTARLRVVNRLLQHSDKTKQPKSFENEPENESELEMD